MNVHIRKANALNGRIDIPKAIALNGNWKQAGCEWGWGVQKCCIRLLARESGQRPKLHRRQLYFRVSHNILLLIEESAISKPISKLNSGLLLVRTCNVLVLAIRRCTHTHTCHIRYSSSTTQPRQRDVSYTAEIPLSHSHCCYWCLVTSGLDELMVDPAEGLYRASAIYPVVLLLLPLLARASGMLKMIGHLGLVLSLVKTSEKSPVRSCQRQLATGDEENRTKQERRTAVSYVFRNS